MDECVFYTLSSKLKMLCKISLCNQHKNQINYKMLNASNKPCLFICCKLTKYGFRKIRFYELVFLQNDKH